MGPKCYHKCPCKEKAEGNWTSTQRREVSVMEAETGVMQLPGKQTEEKVM